MDSKPNYNDWKWHGWNGGECPVHPKTEINILFADTSGTGATSTVCAGGYSWDGIYTPVAFRVVKEYPEPREFWSFCGVAFGSLERAKSRLASLRAERPSLFDDTTITHWREVL